MRVEVPLLALAQHCFKFLILMEIIDLVNRKCISFLEEVKSMTPWYDQDERTLTYKRLGYLLCYYLRRLLHLTDIFYY